MLDILRLQNLSEPTLARRPEIADGIERSVAYLASTEARESVEVDPYWPKWSSPWWHMLLLHELGEARRIPRDLSEAMAARMDRLLHFFPLSPDEQRGVDPYRDVPCHCALGTMTQVLSASGVDVDRALPWVRPWFVRYQMADGGLSCDDEAYGVQDECPSSMVATVPVLEALLTLGARTDEERRATDRAGLFLLERALVRGSSTRHNADERTAAHAWPRLTFPRFYFYDVLRGLAALVRWAESTAHPLPSTVLAPVVDELLARWPDGVVHVERNAYEGRTTLVPTADRSPSPRAPALSFPLLDAVRTIGEPSEALTRQWSATRAGLLRLAQRGLLGV